MRTGEFSDKLARRMGLPDSLGTAEEHMQAISQCRRRAKECCESPIEQVLYLHMWHDAEQSKMSCVPQVQIGQYRVDFVVEIQGEKVIVECDGHDFHEKTKDQAARDKKRDRWLTLQGYKVFRFTGSEIWRDPEIVTDHLEADLDDLLAAIFEKKYYGGIQPRS